MSFFQEGMKKDFCVVKLVGKGGDSLLESGENAAGERVTQMVNIWMRIMWCGAQNLVLFTGIFVQDFLNMQMRPVRVVQSFFPPYFSENGWSPTWDILCLAGIP